MAHDNDPDMPCEERLEATKVETHEPREEPEQQQVKPSNDFGQRAERLNPERPEERRRGQPDRRRWPRIGAVARRASQQAP